MNISHPLTDPALPPQLTIDPIRHPLNVTVRVPGSKSMTNRALLIAALTNGITKISNALFSDDSKYFANALKTLGFHVQLDEANLEMKITGMGGSIPAEKAWLFIGNAGTAARFLTAFLKLGHGQYIIDGDARMRERPIGDLVKALNQIVDEYKPVITDPWTLVPAYSQMCLPLMINGRGLYGGKTRIAGETSSQFISAILMVAPYARSPVEIELTTELNSKPYVDMTIAVMKDFGVEIERNGYSSFTIHPSIYLPIANYQIESDASAASYFFAAPAICGGMVKVENISRKSIQGDIAFLDILGQMGCEVTEGNNYIEVKGTHSLQGVDVDMRDIPDTAQTLAAIAPFASSPTRIRGIASARLKETDRVSATCTELKRLGVEVEEHEDGMTVYPTFNPSTSSGRRLKPANIKTYNDHRMAMSFALIGLCCDGVVIENPACVSKTFPNYFDVLDTLR